MLPTLALVKNQKVDSYIVGFDELGGKDDFSTEVLAARLEQAGLLWPSGGLDGVALQHKTSEGDRQHQPVGTLQCTGGAWRPAWSSRVCKQSRNELHLPVAGCMGKLLLLWPSDGLGRWPCNTHPPKVRQQVAEGCQRCARLPSSSATACQHKSGDGEPPRAGRK